jgi:hypothetical protein
MSGDGSMCTAHASHMLSIVYLAAQIIPDVFIVAATPGLSYSLHLIKNEIETDAFFFKATGMIFMKHIGTNSVFQKL